MSEGKIAFTFQNQQDDDIEVVIEPWAVAETVAPGGIVRIEANATPPPEMEFSVTQSSQQYIYVMSENVAISVDGKVLHDFTSSFRPPMEAFRVLNRLLWGKPGNM